MASDGEVGLTLSQNLGVGVRGTALTVANGQEDLVLSRVEWFLFRGLSLQVELGAILTGGNAHGELSISKWFSIRGVDGDLNETGTSLVNNSEDHVDLKGGTLGTGGGVGGDRVNGGSSIVINGADLQGLAVVDGIGVSNVDQFDEFINAFNGAEQVADSVQGLGGQVAAESATGTDNANVGNDVNEFLDRFIEELDTETRRKERGRKDVRGGKAAREGC